MLIYFLDFLLFLIHQPILSIFFSLGDLLSRRLHVVWSRHCLLYLRWLSLLSWLGPLFSISDALLPLPFLSRRPVLLGLLFENILAHSVRSIDSMRIIPTLFVRGWLILDFFTHWIMLIILLNFVFLGIVWVYWMVAKLAFCAGWDMNFLLRVGVPAENLKHRGFLCSELGGLAKVAAGGGEGAAHA